MMTRVKTLYTPEKTWRVTALTRCCGSKTTLQRGRIFFFFPGQFYEKALITTGSVFQTDDSQENDVFIPSGAGRVYITMHEWRSALSVNCCTAWWKILARPQWVKFAGWLCEQAISFQTQKLQGAEQQIFWSVHAEPLGSNSRCASPWQRKMLTRPSAPQLGSLGCMAIGWEEHKHPAPSLMFLPFCLFWQIAFFPPILAPGVRMKPTWGRKCETTSGERKLQIDSPTPAADRHVEYVLFCEDETFTCPGITLQLLSTGSFLQMGRCYPLYLSSAQGVMLGGNCAEFSHIWGWKPSNCQSKMQERFTLQYYNHASRQDERLKFDISANRGWIQTFLCHIMVTLHIYELTYILGDVGGITYGWRPAFKTTFRHS